MTRFEEERAIYARLRQNTRIERDTTNPRPAIEVDYELLHRLARFIAYETLLKSWHHSLDLQTESYREVSHAVGVAIEALDRLIETGGNPYLVAEAQHLREDMFESPFSRYQTPKRPKNRPPGSATWNKAEAERVLRIIDKFDAKTSQKRKSALLHAVLKELGAVGSITHGTLEKWLKERNKAKP